MAIISNKKLRFIKKSFDGIEAARTYSETAGRVVFDQTHQVICVDGKVYGAGAYHGAAANHDELVRFLSDTNNIPGFMYSIAFADGETVQAGTPTPTPGAQSAAGGDYPTVNTDAMYDGEGEVDDLDGMSVDKYGAIYGDIEGTVGYTEGIRNQIRITITQEDAAAIKGSNGSIIAPNTYESGDLFIYTGRTWNVVTGEDQVINETNIHSFEGTTDINYETSSTPWNTDGLKPRPVRRSGATSLTGQFYDINNAAEKPASQDPARNMAIVTAPVAEVDGIDIDLTLKNPTLTDGSLVAYNKVQIGNLTIPKGYAIPAGVLMEDILRAMITQECYPAAPTAPKMNVSGAKSFGVVCLGDGVNPDPFTSTITKGSYDGTGQGTESASNNWTNDSNKGLPLAASVVRTSSIQVAQVGFVGAITTSTNGAASGNDWKATLDPGSLVTIGALGAGNTLTATFSGTAKRPVDTDKPRMNTGTQIAGANKGKSWDEKSIAGAANTAWWADITFPSQTQVQTATGILPLFTSFAVSEGNTSGLAGSGYGAQAGQLSKKAGSKTYDSSRIHFTASAVAGTGRVDVKLNVGSESAIYCTFTTQSGTNANKIWVPTLANVYVWNNITSKWDLQTTGVHYSTSTETINVAGTNRTYTCVDLGAAAQDYRIDFTKNLATA